MVREQDDKWSPLSRWWGQPTVPHRPHGTAVASSTSREDLQTLAPHPCGALTPSPSSLSDASAGRDWPPVDQFKQRAKAPSKLKRAALERDGQAGTWTTGSLLATDPRMARHGGEAQAEIRQRSGASAGVGTMRAEMPRVRSKAPYAAAPPDSGHARDGEETSTDYEMDEGIDKMDGVHSEEDEDDDERPLGSLLARQRSLRRSDRDDDDADAPPPAVRVRRGSEGYEVRPKVRAPPSTWAHELSDSEEEDGEVGWELDEQGDRRRTGARYNYYEPEAESSEELGSSDSDGSWE